MRSRRPPSSFPWYIPTRPFLQPQALIFLHVRVLRGPRTEEVLHRERSTSPRFPAITCQPGKQVWTGIRTGRCMASIRRWLHGGTPVCGTSGGCIQSDGISVAVELGNYVRTEKGDKAERNIYRKRRNQKIEHSEWVAQSPARKSAQPTS